MNATPADRRSLTRFAWLSISAAFATIVLKGAAYFVTGSVGLLSDAVESLVNLVGATMALWMLAVAGQPPDEEHAHGHGKAEYFSSGTEGALIVVAAFAIGYAALHRLMAPQPLERIGLGLLISVAASLVNLGVALLLLRAGRRERSITLEADARHLLTDVWTTAGVLVGLASVSLTGWQWLDPVVALAVASNIIWTGVGIMRSSISGLMDVALPQADQAAVRQVLEESCRDGVRYDTLLTRQAGAHRFVSVRVQVPGEWTVARGHGLLEQIEAAIRSALPETSVLTHLEPLGDSATKQAAGKGVRETPQFRGASGGHRGAQPSPATKRIRSS
jgi:cation diffusion facilitator family transporter